MRYVAGQAVSYLEPVESWRYFRVDPLKLAILVLTTFALAYGARLDNYSPLTADFLENFIGNLGIVELIMFFLPVLELVRRVMTRDLWVSRSSASRSVLWVGIVIVLYPLIHMAIVEERLRLPWEIAFLPMLVVSFFVWLFLFRPEDLYLMVWMVVIGGLFKAIEALSVFASVGLMWGLLTGWRDAMLLTMMVLGGIFAYVVRPDGDEVYARIRKFLLWTLPITGIAFAGCLRRGFILGFLVALAIVAFSLSREERRSLRKILIPVLGVLTVGLFMIDISNFIYRISGITDPGSEGSAAYRVLEFYNTWNMVLERPLTGWPMGTDMINYTVIDFILLSRTIPHNSYLYALVRAGIFGLLAWLWMLGSMCAIHLRTIRASRRPFERFLALWLSTSTILMIFTGFTTPVFTDHLQMFYPFLMVMASFLPGAWQTGKRFVPAFERA